MELHQVLEARRVLAVLRGDDAAGVVPTGAVDVPAVGHWIAPGALAVGLGTALCSPGDVRRRHWGPVVDRAHALLRSPARA